MRTNHRLKSTTKSQPPPSPEPTPENDSLPWLLYGGISLLFVGVALFTGQGTPIATFPQLSNPTLTASSPSPTPLPSPTSTPQEAPPTPTPVPTPQEVTPSPPPIPQTPPTLTPQTLYQQSYRAVVVIRTSSGQGSGALIQNGNMTIIVTNNHVVDDNPVVQVTTVQGLSYQGTVLARNPKTDLAIVKIQTSLQLPTLSLNTQTPEIGQTVYALGNPLGMERTFTQGIVSRLEQGDGDIDHSASIAPGSSGSPLLNENGEVIGINKAHFREFKGLGIATPAAAVNDLQKAVEP